MIGDPLQATAELDGAETDLLLDDILQVSASQALGFRHLSRFNVAYRQELVSLSLSALSDLSTRQAYSKFSFIQDVSDSPPAGLKR